MNTQFKTISLLFLLIITFVSCDTSDGDDIIISPPISAAFKSISEKGLKKNTQNFTITAGTGVVTLTSAKGVKLTLNGDCLTKNGNPVTGQVDIEYVELFDKGNMLISNKPTMGIMPDGKKNLLISGGEFFIKATQGGVELKTSCYMNLIVPTALTNGLDNAMTLWNGVIDERGELAWEQPKPNADGTGVKAAYKAKVQIITLLLGNLDGQMWTVFTVILDQKQHFW